MLKKSAASFHLRFLFTSAFVRRRWCFSNTFASSADLFLPSLLASEEAENFYNWPNGARECVRACVSARMRV